MSNLEFADICITLVKTLITYEEVEPTTDGSLKKTANVFTLLANNHTIFKSTLFSKIVCMFISFDNQTLNSEFCSQAKLKIVHSHCHMKALHCMMKIIHQIMKIIH